MRPAYKPVPGAENPHPILIAVLFLWQLPQNVVGLLVLLYAFARPALCPRKTQTVPPILSFERGRLFVQGRIGVSLGQFVFWFGMRKTEGLGVSTVNKEHEYGHSLQSAMLGPAYLLIVGLPSALRALYSRRCYRRHGRGWERYFHGFPEYWADRLGKVDSATGRHLT